MNGPGGDEEEENAEYVYKEGRKEKDGKDPLRATSRIPGRVSEKVSVHRMSTKAEVDACRGNAKDRSIPSAQRVVKKD